MKKTLSRLRKKILPHPLVFGLVVGAIGGFVIPTSDLFFDMGYSFNEVLSPRFIRRVVKSMLFYSITMGLMFYFGVRIDRLVRGERSSSNADDGRSGDLHTTD